MMRVGPWKWMDAFEPCVRSEKGVRRSLARTTLGCEHGGAVSFGCGGRCKCEREEDAPEWTTR